MSLWNDMPQITSPPQTSDLSVVLDYVKKLANTTAKMAKDLEFILNGNVAFDNIRVNGIEAQNIKAGAITAEKIDVEELSAISANVGKVVSGEIYGNYIATSEHSYPRAEMSNTTRMFKVESAPGVGIEMRSIGSQNIVPEMNYFNNGYEVRSSLPGPHSGLHFSGPKVTMEIDDIYLRGYNAVHVLDWSRLKNEQTGTTISNELDNKANVSEAGFNMTFDNGSRNLKLWGKQGNLLAQVYIPPM